MSKALSEIISQLLHCLHTLVCVTTAAEPEFNGNIAEAALPVAVAD